MQCFSASGLTRTRLPQTMTVRVMVDDFDAVCTYQMIDADGDVLPAAFKMHDDEAL